MCLESFCPQHFRTNLRFHRVQPVRTRPNRPTATTTPSDGWRPIRPTSSCSSLTARTWACFTPCPLYSTRRSSLTFPFVTFLLSFLRETVSKLACSFRMRMKTPGGLDSQSSWPEWLVPFSAGLSSTRLTGLGKKTLAVLLFTDNWQIEPPSLCTPSCVYFAVSFRNARPPGQRDNLHRS